MTNSHSARPSAWKTSGAPARSCVGQVRQQAAQREPLVLGRLGDLRPGDHREPGPVVLLAEQHPQPLRRLLGLTHGIAAVDGLDAGAGDDEHPGLRVGPPLLEPGVVAASYRDPVVGAGGHALVRVRPRLT